MASILGEAKSKKVTSPTNPTLVRESKVSSFGLVDIGDGEDFSGFDNLRMTGYASDVTAGGFPVRFYTSNHTSKFCNVNFVIKMLKDGYTEVLSSYGITREQSKDLFKVFSGTFTLKMRERFVRPHFLIGTYYHYLRTPDAQGRPRDPEDAAMAALDSFEATVSTATLAYARIRDMDIFSNEVYILDYDYDKKEMVPYRPNYSSMVIPNYNQISYSNESFGVELPARYLLDVTPEPAPGRVIPKLWLLKGAKAPDQKFSDRKVMKDGTEFNLIQFQTEGRYTLLLMMHETSHLTIAGMSGRFREQSFCGFVDYVTLCRAKSVQSVIADISWGRRFLNGMCQLDGSFAFIPEGVSTGTRTMERTLKSAYGRYAIEKANFIYVEERERLIKEAVALHLTGSVISAKQNTIDSVGMYALLSLDRVVAQILRAVYVGRRIPDKMTVMMGESVRTFRISWRKFGVIDDVATLLDVIFKQVVIQALFGAYPDE